MKVCVVVPVYNGGSFIDNVIADLLKKTDLDILVVDDGSDQAVDYEDRTQRLKIHRFEENSGKGKALQWALSHCHKKGYTHILSFDGDGQHLAKDVGPMVSAGESEPKALVLGTRVFDETVPGISQFGRKFSNFWVYYQTGQKVADSQSGLRLYPLEKLSQLKYFSSRYDFEIEVLVRALWQKVPLREVEVGVLYPKERISHFDKLRDNVRITLLNIYLIAWSLIFYRLTWTRKLVVAVLSVPLSALSPFWLSLLSGVTVCVFFRLNAIVMLLCLLALYFI